MKLARTMTAAAALLVVLLTSTVYAAGCCGGMMGGQPGAVLGDLTKEQQKQVADLRTEFLKKQEQLRAEMGKKRIELMELAQKENPDEPAIEKKRQEIWSLQDAMRNGGANLWHEVQSASHPGAAAEIRPRKRHGLRGGRLAIRAANRLPGCPVEYLPSVTFQDACPATSFPVKLVTIDRSARGRPTGVCPFSFSRIGFVIYSGN